MLHDQFINPMTEAELQQALGLRFARAAHERFDHAGASAPGDMEARHRVAMPDGAMATALSPAHHRKPAHAHGVKPTALVARGKIHVSLGPALGPVILGTVERRRAHPVGQRQGVRITHTHAPLFRRVDEEQTAE